MQPKTLRLITIIGLTVLGTCGAYAIAVMAFGPDYTVLFGLYGTPVVAVLVATIASSFAARYWAQAGEQEKEEVAPRENLLSSEIPAKRRQFTLQSLLLFVTLAATFVGAVRMTPGLALYLFIFVALFSIARRRHRPGNVAARPTLKSNPQSDMAVVLVWLLVFVSI